MKVVQERLGHRASEVTADIYSHVAPDLQERAAGLFGVALREGIRSRRNSKTPHRIPREADDPGAHTVHGPSPTVARAPAGKNSSRSSETSRGLINRLQESVRWASLRRCASWSRAIACPESLISHVERLTECAVEQFVEDGGSAWCPTQHLGDREIGQAQVHHQRTSERT